MASTMAVKTLSEKAYPVSPHNKFVSGLKIGICLFLACLGASWFSYQLFFVPQPAYFVPQWQRAQWIQASDNSNNPVSYFRYSTNLNVAPDAAFVTIAANQSFRLYINGTLIATNDRDVTNGGGTHAYIYDVISSLRRGPNVVAVYVSNFNGQIPSVRANLGMRRGNSTSYYGSDTSWQATNQVALAYPRYAIYGVRWDTRDFDATLWPSAAHAAIPAQMPQLEANPELYEQPLATSWISAGAGHDGYFVRSVSLPADTTHTWLRAIATGPASIFINGRLFTVWNGEVRVKQQLLINYSSNGHRSRALPQYTQGLMLGIYDTSPYFHAGINTIAVHVASPGNNTAQVNLQTLRAAFSLDLLVNDSQNHNIWVTSDVSGTAWRTSSQSVAGWERGSDSTLVWGAPLYIGRPGVSKTVYLPDSSSFRNAHVSHFSSLATILLINAGVVVGIWLVLALVVMRRYYYARSDALAALSIIYMPALAVEALLIVLSCEPLMPRPFPYTGQWGLVLIALVGLGFLLQWFHCYSRYENLSLHPDIAQLQRNVRAVVDCIPLWWRRHWGLLVIMLLATPLIWYHLSYEPYWQDELTSYYAAKGILAHGVPVMPSGFLYPKGELYSYLLALSIALFGEQNGMIRFPSVLTYLASLPLFYLVTRYFFERKIALLATAMLAFSPYVLIWGRGVRMYELAQFMVILVMYMFYKAAHNYRHPRLPYWAILSLLAMYLSHEETFIFLPVLVVGVLFVSKDATHRLPGVLYQKHWWIAAILGVGIISVQLLIVKFSHPAVLGTDQSQQPLLQLMTDNLPYYIKLLFFPSVTGKQVPILTVNSILAGIGCVWALHAGDTRARYCTLFLVIPLVLLVLVFTPTADRYIYPLLPAFYMLGAFALMSGLRLFWSLARVEVMRQSPSGALLAQRTYGLNGPNVDEYTYRSDRDVMVWNKVQPAQPLRWLMLFTTALACASVLILPALPSGNYDLFTSRMLGISYRHHYPDYDGAGQYIKQHWRDGDIVISVSPAISILYYVGRVDYFVSTDRALYLFERNSAITDTPTGSVPLLNQSDLDEVLARHGRVWIVTGKALNQTVVPKRARFLFPADFRRVYQGYTAIVYLRDG
ncbi:hypothetical protein KSF_057150 [Reticulibacter mediterranei]|uniref:Glycosyltransferase RgtA/B/C/D-like domain-containing protein n=1 Tax=Reticulibacter mediterranei TaxID=2778369 RepID=A0A8J3IRQ0_9CHLR|nr:glycosyltransferase family 39 protein [Reticulibacter mediterranei]GHO95667.1 hypothetical protein KSF_057150 [Reticulibacter mediterranei]